MKSKFKNLNLGEINVLSAEQKKGVTGGYSFAFSLPDKCYGWREGSGWGKYGC